MKESYVKTWIKYKSNISRVNIYNKYKYLCRIVNELEILENY